MSISPPAAVAGLAAIADKYDVILSDVWGAWSMTGARIRRRPPMRSAVFARAARSCSSPTPRPWKPIQKMLDNFGLPRESYDVIVSSGRRDGRSGRRAE